MGDERGLPEAFNLDSIPAEIRAYPQWVCWRAVEKRRKDGSTKIDKIPTRPDGSNAATNDPLTWSTFEEVVAAWRSDPRRIAGVGFVFGKEDPFVGVDLDGCLDGGEVAPWALPWLVRFSGAYVEESCSGTGLHLIVRGRLPGGGGSRKVGDAAHTAIEIYDSARFFVMTGRAVGDIPAAVANGQAAVEGLYGWVKERPAKPAAKPKPVGSPPSPMVADRDDRIRRAKLYLAKTPPAIEEQDGSKATMWACGVAAVGFDLSDDDAFLALQGWNAGCNPPWPEEGSQGLRRKIAEARKNTQNPVGWLLNQPDERAKAAGGRSRPRPKAAGPGESPPAEAPPDGPAPGGGDRRPEILVTPREAEVVAQVVETLGRDPNLFVLGHCLATIVEQGKAPRGVDFRGEPPPPQIQPLEAITVRERITAFADLVKIKKVKDGEVLVSVHPPDWLAPMVHKRRSYPGVRPIIGVIETPTMRPDGSILETPGYDPSTQLYYRPNATFPRVPSRPTRKQAEEARDRILDVVGDFPFKTPEDRAVWVAGFLEPFARPAIDGPCPLVAIDANTAGAGKTKSTDIISVASTGRPMPRTVWPSGQNGDEEVRKRITSLALAGTRMTLIDNIDTPLGGASLDAALTSQVWQDRRLGTMEMTPELPLHTIFYASGNNIQFRGDVLRRVLSCRLESTEEAPEKRTGFKYPNLLQHVKEVRGDLVAAALTILRAYWIADDKVSIDPLGSYESWTRVVAEPVLWITGCNPLEVQDRTKAADAATVTRNALILGWAELPGGPEKEGGLTCAEALKLLKASEHLDRFPILRNALAELSRDAELPSTHSLGAHLRKLEGKVVDGKRIKSGENRVGTKVWMVGAASKSTPGNPNGPQGVRGAQGGDNGTPCGNSLHLNPSPSQGLDAGAGSAGSSSVSSAIKTSSDTVSEIENNYYKEAAATPCTPLLPAPDDRESFVVVDGSPPLPAGWEEFEL